MMICDICHEREATLFLQQSINGNDRRVKICGQCTEEIREGTKQAKTLEEHEQIEEARELMMSIDPMNMGMDDNFLQPFRDLMRRFNRPTIDRRRQSFWDSEEWAWPFAFGQRAMRPLEQIAIPDTEAKMREERASRLVFHEDGTVSLRGEEDAASSVDVESTHEVKSSDAVNADDTDTHVEQSANDGTDQTAEDEVVHGQTEVHSEPVDVPDEQAEAQAATPSTKSKDLTDIELIKMNFGEVMHYTDEVSTEERRTILARRRDLAVQEEDYELAAEIRDALKSLK